VTHLFDNVFHPLPLAKDAPRADPFEAERTSQPAPDLGLSLSVVGNVRNESFGEEPTILGAIAALTAAA
jgi:hypothetical protein